ncbi:hypothetical protein BZA05DRAFT_442252 [Tricharina praecox]|uniref:uncharacterized protein n=1 Tax=Tricharina praecox TaxID=43433 RepID=UPI00221F28BF|nr:uncharacterized protein BZA05DRAFT_442252 [Tricharina praecox]KAI5856574.1 hypothetical protein BZA05DRAFT_442252 [Tricharina praecox]
MSLFNVFRKHCAQRFGKEAKASQVIAVYSYCFLSTGLSWVGPYYATVNNEGKPYDKRDEEYRNLIHCCR